LIVVLIIIGIPVLVGVLSGVFEDMASRPSKEDRERMNQKWNSRFHAGFVQDILGVKVVSKNYNGSFGLAGIQINDRILKIDDMEIHNLQEVVNMEPNYDEVVTIEVMRKGEALESPIQVYILDVNNKGNILASVGEKVFKQMMTVKSTDYILAYDTNILMKYPLLFSKFTNTNKILLAKQAFDELDNKKTDTENGYKARNALKMIEQCQKDGAEIIFSSVSDSYTKSKNLDPSKPDERIIASYIYEMEVNNKKVFFITEDRGARILGRQAGLETIDW
jgi:hypothetical protein